MPDYSPELIRLYYKLECERQAKADAAKDLRFARCVRIAVASLLDKRNAKSWSQFEKQHIAMIQQKEQDPQANINSVAKLVQRMIGR